jgi:chromosome partitioning protein
MKLILIANSAGGVGKTTTALSCAVAATEYGKKVLLIDADARAALSFACGIENPRVTTKELLSKEFSLDSAVVRTSERFSMIPASTRLVNLAIEDLISTTEFAGQVKDFDLVIVDTSSGFDQYLSFFAAIADLVLLPTTTDILAIRGALHAKDFATAVGYNKNCELLFTKTQPDFDLPKFLAEVDTLGTDFSILEPAISNSPEVPNSQSAAKSALSTANQSQVAAEYREVTYTLLEKLELI